MDHHQLGVYLSSKTEMEKVGPAFLQEGLFRARAKTIEVLDEIRV